MEEKKLTDEEIVKSLECCTVLGRCTQCPYSIKGIDCLNEQSHEKDILDFIHRLQDESAKQKAEIEQLEKDVHDMSWIIKIHKYCVGADHCQNSSMKEFKLQKQVDELKKLNAKYLESIESVQAGRCRFRCELTQQAVKDTAKEILQYVGDLYDDGDQRFQLKDYQWHNDLCKKYGVEVE